MYTYKDFRGSSHRILLELMRKHCRTRGRLVDVGAAGGELGENARSLFDKGLALEYDRRNLPSLRRRFDAAAIVNLEEIDSLPRAGTIVLADVIEHLREPGRMLRLARTAIEPDGLLFVSVPNVANLAIRASLLFGSFRYGDRGILDRTHLRFYTLDTVREEVRQSGFEIVSTHGSALPLRLVAPWIPEILLQGSERLLTVLASIWTSMFGYQIILVARPAGNGPRER
ncbi:MAG TPA: class I SAM-dependent methyltransferase [Thermoanaerobaculia bacterium]|nr:class I SAM-dependent methyltransferase [Thermoanaerobaculia bacterium]